MSNRSLDEFAAADVEEPAAAGDVATEPTDGERADDGEDPVADERAAAAADPEPAPDPPVSTYAWRPEGGPCAVCGAVVAERWRADDGLVCPDCKEW